MQISYLNPQNQRLIIVKTMGIDEICDKITNLINQVRTPLKYVPAVLLVCGALKRPGLSAMLLTSRIIEKADALGLPIGVAADGSPCLWTALLAAGMEVTTNSIKTEGGVQVGTAVGGVQVTVVGPNGVSQGTNTNFIHSGGIFG